MANIISAHHASYHFWLRLADTLANKTSMSVQQARVGLPLSHITKWLQDRDRQWIDKLIEARAGADNSTTIGQLLWRLEVPPIALRDDAFPTVKAAQAIRKHFYEALLKMARETELKTISDVLLGLGIQTKSYTSDDAVSAILLHMHQTRADAGKRACSEELPATQNE